MFAAALCAAAIASVAVAGSSGAAPAHQPDAWLKLCGPTNTCVLQPWHPWIGNDIYSGTGNGERLQAGVEEGNMIRFWVAIQNDGSSSETFKVKSCSGTSAFPLKSVNVGPYRAFTSEKNVTTQVKSGTARFSFPPSSVDKTVIVTLTFLAATSSKGTTYSCPVTVSSVGHAAAKDTVVAKMVTI
jgi:hypothetical protein